MSEGSCCSGITSASHAEGPGFKSQWVHIVVNRSLLNYAILYTHSKQHLSSSFFLRLLLILSIHISAWCFSETQIYNCTHLCLVFPPRTRCVCEIECNDIGVRSKSLSRCSFRLHRPGQGPVQPRRFFCDRTRLRAALHTSLPGVSTKDQVCL